MIKYMTTTMNRKPLPSIQKYECERETESSLWINGDRYLKKTSCDNYFGTWEEAWQYIFERASMNIVEAEDYLAECQARLEEIRLLKERG